MQKARLVYYALSGTLSLLAVIFCVLVYLSGEFEIHRLGMHYLTGLPNYYFFYIAILPFVSAAVLYLALNHRYIRLFGELSRELDEKHRIRQLKLRKLLVWMALIFSILITARDAADKNHLLLPCAYAFASEQAYAEVAETYACLKGWIACQPQTGDGADIYLAVLKSHGFTGERATGFETLTQWYLESSWLYKFESLLSFLAALIISLFAAEVFLLLAVKNYVLPATKQLIVWLLLIASFWLPTKIYSSWYLGMGQFSPPSVFWFALLLLILGVLLVLFIKTERNEIYKYASVLAAIGSTGIAGLSWFKPEWIQLLFEIVMQLGWIYGLLLLCLFCLALFLVTDHFIGNYEEEAMQLD